MEYLNELKQKVTTLLAGFTPKAKRDQWIKEVDNAKKEIKTLKATHKPDYQFDLGEKHANEWGFVNEILSEEIKSMSEKRTPSSIDDVIDMMSTDSAHSKSILQKLKSIFQRS